MEKATVFKTANSLCTPSKLPASDYVINPYIGCTHRCMYCYACFMGRFTGHKEPWGSYIEPKKYLSMALPRNLEGKTILIGSVTDAYNSAEKSFKLMPSILDALKDCRARVEILTKSKLVTRDIEKIKKIPNVAVGVSISNLNELDNAIIESGASSASERLEALKLLHDNGIETYLFVAPYLPGITNLRELYERAKGSIDYMCVENLNLRGSYKSAMLHFIHDAHPRLAYLYDSIYMQKNGEYWETVEDEIKTLRRIADVPIISYMYHEKIRK